MIYTMHASKDGKEVESDSISAIVIVARARRLLREGWDVRITTKIGLIFFPDEFDALLSFDPHA